MTTRKITSMVKRLDQPEVFKEIHTLGKAMVDSNSGAWQLKKSKLRQILTDTKGSNDIKNCLVDVRNQADKINKLTEVNWMKKFFMSDSKIVTKALVKYEDIEKVVEKIVTAMESAADMLAQDSDELANMSSWIDDQQLDIEGVLAVMKDTIDALENPGGKKYDVAKVERLKVALYARSQDLAIISSAYKQFTLAITQTITNNDREIETAKRMKIIISTVAETGLIIRAAMSRQDRVNELNTSAKDFTAQLITQNAQNFKAQTIASKKSVQDMSQIMTALKEAHAVISESLAEELIANEELTVAAKSNLKELEELHLSLSEIPSLKELPLEDVKTPKRLDG
jgi:uncharacterized protein YaaN involved in tellurite resistance